jgi:hypothetical protein
MQQALKDNPHIEVTYLLSLSFMGPFITPIASDGFEL